MTTSHETLSTYSPTLVVDFNRDAATQLAEQLSHFGFPVDIAGSSQNALASACSKRYHSVVMVADLTQETDLECLTGLRKRAGSAWIIVVSARPCTHAEQIIRRRGADSLLIAPFTLEELTFRLSAFSHRSRPP
jgi:two-component system response regulator QseB